jgi:hypothetical protein
VEETVRDLKAAQERTEELSVEEPGAYFVFDPEDHRVLAEIDTTVDHAQS